MAASHRVCWQVFAAGGPALAHHAGAIIHNTLYIHGGIHKKGSTSPCNNFYKLDLESPIWQEVRVPGSPALSHHACVVLHLRHLVFIGGWDGKARSSQVSVFDTEKECWMTMSTTGFPDGAGLSSHTANVLHNGNILIIGREGSLRTQRRSGNAFMLGGDIAKGKFRYEDLPMGVASRSGHTANSVSSRLYIIGGRNDSSVEIHQGCKAAMVAPSVMEQLNLLIAKSTPMAKPPCGRKHHVSVAGSGAIFIHGGETFDGRSREPVGEMFLLTVTPTMKWYKLGTSPVGRQGHLCCASLDKVLIHGGLGARNIVHGDTYQLDLT